MGDDFEDQKTPERGAAAPEHLEHPGGLTESQRHWFAQRLTSGVPVVQPRDTPQPHELLARTTTPDELEILRHFRIAGSRTALEEFVVKLFGEHRQLRRDLNRKIEDDSSDNEAALVELRTLLAKPPNGRVAELKKQVETMEEAIDTRFDALERKLAAEATTDQVEDVKDDHRFKSLEGDARFAKRTAQSVIVFLILSLGAAGIWIGIREQRLETVIETLKDHNTKLDSLLSRQKVTP